MLGVGRPVQRQRVLGRSGHVEVVGRAAHCHHQLVKRQAAGGYQLFAVFVQHGRHLDFLARQVQPGEGAQAEVEAVVVRQHFVRQAFLVDVQRARGHLVQRRLPDVEQLLVHQGDLLHAEFSAQLAGQFEAACAAAHDHDANVHEISLV
ncbi:hypothetical protein FQZ97_937560 [compost metagenome]